MLLGLYYFITERLTFCVYAASAFSALFSAGREKCAASDVFHTVSSFQTALGPCYNPAGVISAGFSYYFITLLFFGAIKSTQKSAQIFARKSQKHRAASVRGGQPPRRILCKGQSRLRRFYAYFIIAARIFCAYTRMSQSLGWFMLLPVVALKSL